jgi:hypothetical protein
MEATIFTGWVYDFLKPYAVDLKVAHPEMLKAITAAKKKNDRADAEEIADLLRVNLLPECHMLSEEIRELRRVLRYRNHIVGTAKRKAAVDMILNIPGKRRVTVGADKGYDTEGFVAALRSMSATPHVAQNNTRRKSAVDHRTTPARSP